MDRKQHCVAMLMDLHQAFDSADHKLLPIKLRSAGFGPQTVDQTQRAYAEEPKSDLLEITKGVPLGLHFGAFFCH